jgi:CheY-like chemotaxis protein
MYPFNKILLIDDDEATNFLSRALLQKLHAAKEILVADDGRMACDLIQRTGCPDVIFLDIRMPHMDGFEFLNCLQTINICKNTKVIMLSSSVLAEDKERARIYVQVMDCLEKPITKEMVEKVKREYGRHEQ